MFSAISYNGKVVAERGWFIFSSKLVYTPGCLKKSAACNADWKSACRACGQWSACADQRVGAGRRPAKRQKRPISIGQHPARNKVSTNYEPSPIQELRKPLSPISYLLLS